MRSLLIAALLLVSASVYGQGKCKLTVHIEFKGVVEGYDNPTKDQLFFNGTMVKETAERPYTTPMDFKLKVARGNTKFKVVNWSQWQGTWELTLQENEYSINGTKEMNLNLAKKNKLTIVYDLDERELSPIITLE